MSATDREGEGSSENPEAGLQEKCLSLIFEQTTLLLSNILLPASLLLPLQ
jgi:hypothetical protein